LPWRINSMNFGARWHMLPLEPVIEWHERDRPHAFAVAAQLVMLL